MCEMADIPGVIEIFLITAVGAAPQIVPPTSEAVLLRSAPANHRLALGSLTLGSGGVQEQVARAGRDRAAIRPGIAVTAGGVRVSAKAEGVKLTFASGRELLVTPSARIHLRSGERTLPFFGGVRLCLADGSVVTIKRGSSSRRPLTSVEVEDGAKVRRIWAAGRRVTHASYSKAFVGSTLFALGDGGSLYRVDRAGPILALSRVLCPERQANLAPVHRLVIAGGVLAKSLKLLPDHAPRKSVQFPQVEEAARRFAALSYLFSRDVARLPGSVGELWFPLADQYRLKISTSDRGVISIGLYRGASDIPGVEWLVASRSTIHFVRPDGGASGGPRYFMRGIDIRRLIEDSAPAPATPGSRQRVAAVMRALGGQQPKKLRVRVAGPAR